MKQTITIIDTYGFFFRSFYALPPLQNREGFPTGLLTGFVNFIFNVVNEHKSDFIVFALDSKGDTFRNEIYREYKANRGETPEDLKLQLPVAIEWIEKMGFTTLSKSGFEADDMIASLAKQAQKLGHNVRVVSHDKDLYQLINDDVVIVDVVKRKDIDAQSCFDKFGVYPKDFTTYQSLVGDSVDNIPGVKGIGAKTAQKLVTAYGTLDNMYNNLELIAPARTQKLLREGKESAYLSQQLVTLDANQHTIVNFSTVTMPTTHPLLKITKELETYELFASLDRLRREGELTEKSSAQKSAGHEFETVLLTDSAELFEIINTIEPDTIIALDTETTGLDPRHDTLVGYSFALSSTKAYYVPMAHNYLGVPNQIEKEEALKALQQLLRFSVVGHNLKFDLNFIYHHINIDQTPIFADTMIMAWLLNPEAAVGLDKQVLKAFNHTMIPFSDTVAKGETFASVALEDACEYAAEDALFTYKLFFKLQEQLQERYGASFMEYIKTQEFPFINTLITVENNGIMVSPSFLERLKHETSTRLSDLTSAIYEQAGTNFNINSTKQLGVILFETLELPVVKKTKTGYSTDEKVLNKLYDEHPIIPLILNYRELFKLYSTYIDPLLTLANEKSDHRIHTSFLQTGTATGRLSSKNPNLQNIPVKNEEGRKIRQAFVAPEGKTLIGIDYSQIELRLLAHFSNDPTLLEAFSNDRDIHLETAKKLFGDEEATEKRSIAKTVNFGLLYGMGSKKLSETLGITTKEAKIIITNYFEAFISIESFMKSIEKKAQETGYSQTLYGRRRYFDFANASPMQLAAFKREAVNTVFQGSAADLIKKAMNKIQNLITTEALNAKLLLQIHDELIFEVNEADAPALASRFQTIMETIETLNVPLQCSVNIAKNWGELK